MRATSRWRLVASYAVGVWGGLTAWAALAQYVLPGRGHALGKLGPALVWCVVGSAIAGGLLRWWELRKMTT